MNLIRACSICQKKVVGHIYHTAQLVAMYICYGQIDVAQPLELDVRILMLSNSKSSATVIIHD